jgi:uncharacterized protein (DUF58 family)
MRQRLTGSGVAFSFFTSLVGALAFLTGNNLLFLMLSALLAAMLVAGFVSRLSLAGLELEFLPPDHITAGRPAAAVIRLRNEKSWVPSFSLLITGTPRSVEVSGLYIPMLRGGATLEDSIQVTFARRGRYSENSFRLVSRFPFGFAERRVDLTLRREVIVYPSLEPHPEAEHLLSGLEAGLEALSRARGTDFYRIRPYDPLESARHVDWKATAHTGELQVREFAAEREPLVEILLDPWIAPGEAALFERAVECCAFLCWNVSARGARVRLRCGNFDRSLPADADVYTMLRFLALAEPRFALVSHGRESPGKEVFAAPIEQDSVQVVLTSKPSRAAESGWRDARIVDMHALGGGAADGAAAFRGAGGGRAGGVRAG